MFPVRLECVNMQKYVFTNSSAQKTEDWTRKESYMLRGCWMLFQLLKVPWVCRFGNFRPPAAQHPRPLHTHHHSTASFTSPHRPIPVSATACDPPWLTTCPKSLPESRPLWTLWWDHPLSPVLPRPPSLCALERSRTEAWRRSSFLSVGSTQNLLFIC